MLYDILCVYACELNTRVSIVSTILFTTKIRYSDSYQQATESGMTDQTLYFHRNTALVMQHDIALGEIIYIYIYYVQKSCHAPHLYATMYYIYASYNSL